MAKIGFILTCFVLIGFSEAFDRQRFPGPYCENRRPEQCCTGRDDQCTVPIHDTLCYCDQFCDEHSVEDCCPDFIDVCKTRPTTGPGPQIRNDCYDRTGRFYDEGNTITKECNRCTCVKIRDRVLGWSCGTDICLNDEDLVARVNTNRFGWTAQTYPKYAGQTLEDGFKYYLGTNRPITSVKRQTPIKIDPQVRFDKSFDARSKWPSYIQPPMDQGKCGASFAFSTAGVASDRWAIQSEGTFTGKLSVQNLVSCSRPFNDGCDGANVVDSWTYLASIGVVEDRCYPYVRYNGTKPGEICKLKDELQCPGGRQPDLHETSNVYRVAFEERQIMKEIQNQGPVQSIIEVHHDLFLYKSGIYRYIGADGDSNQQTVVGTHSVKIIGWGEENGVKYWLVMNSWGTGWGDGGLFKIIRGNNEVGVEDFVLAVWASVEKHAIHERKFKHKHRRH